MLKQAQSFFASIQCPPLGFPRLPSEIVSSCHCEGVKRPKQSQETLETTRLPRLRALPSPKRLPSARLLEVGLRAGRRNVYHGTFHPQKALRRAGTLPPVARKDQK